MAARQNRPMKLKAKLFRGLSDPSRLAILETLRSGKKMVSEIVALTGLSQPNVSGHLTCLRDCGILTSKQEGRRVIYGLSSPHMAALMEAAETILAGVSERIACCSNYECRTALVCIGGKTCAAPIQGSPAALRAGAEEPTRARTASRTS